MLTVVCTHSGVTPRVTFTLFTSCAGVPTLASAAEASENVTSLSAIDFFFFTTSSVLSRHDLQALNGEREVQ